MTAMVNTVNHTAAFQDIMNHPAWLGEVPGLVAEKMLRGRKTPYLYVIRAGEKSNKANEANYYVTYLDANLSVRHQPVVVTETVNGRLFENASAYIGETIEEVVHLIMHCEQGQSVALQQ